MDTNNIIFIIYKNYVDKIIKHGLRFSRLDLEWNIEILFIDRVICTNNNGFNMLKAMIAIKVFESLP